MNSSWVIPVIPISCGMVANGRKIGKAGQAIEIRKALILKRFVLKSNRRKSKVITWEGGFESLRPDH